ncbi:hypothetical protein KJ611_03065 [Patescibacteria group bacterium]|nr:hypothetical protein [Patescibacteria group bacterium]MBU1705562.1 hypothetical protein [Patescibacteria group bacterium]
MKSSVYQKIAQDHASREKARRQIINQANNALSTAKRAIFALHRDDRKSAQDLLDEAKKIFVNCEKSFKAWPDLAYEGAYLAALEEYAEALLFFGYVKNGKIAAIDQRCMRAQTYLAGLSDTTGEIVRLAIRQATAGNFQSVEQAVKTVEEVIAYLYELDLTSYLRTKFDQAKKNLRHLEEMRYEISLRK